jgi:glycosyltransferase involved in cell wall biosynthesis/SAM-dependent methyltransferase
VTFAFLIDSVQFSRATVAGETSLGGSESACVGLARALKGRGHDVHIYATKLDDDAAGPDAGGVVWHPAAEFRQTNSWIEWDVVVALRQYAWFAAPVQARMRLLWNQDLLMPGVGKAIMSVGWQLDRMVYVSDYHRRQWEDEQPELAPLGWATKNGFDASLVPTDAVKHPNRIIHISRPERALDPILAMWPEVRKQRPDAELHICRYQSMYDSEGSNVKAACEMYDRKVAQVNAQVGGLTWLGSLGKRDLYRAIAESAVMWYPGIDSFAETSCISAIEAQANGTPFVGSWKGALPETVPSGVLVPGDAMSPAYQAQSIAAVLEALKGCETQGFAYRKQQIAGRTHVKGYTYDAIAAEWEAQIEAWFTERYETKKRAILDQLLQEDDHCAAKVVAQDIIDACVKNGEPHDGTVCLAACNANDFCDRVIAGLEQGADDYAAHAIQDPLAELELSGRFHTVIPRFKDCASVLDAACGNGAFAIGLALAHPTIHVHGLDYAQGNIDLARATAERVGVADRVTFERRTIVDLGAQTMHPDWFDFAASHPHEFDGLFVGEFVEHVANTPVLVDALEAALQPGALVIYTCPMGPFGELVQRGTPLQRGHVHSFKTDDIKAVWGQKQDVGADFFEIGLTGRGNPIGHWIIHYRAAEGRPAGARDLMTRAKRTRPKQKLSVGLIAKNAELDLARCLTSVWTIADEIVIGDTGSTDATAQIAASFGARVLPLDPIEAQPEGFAGARNAVLQACTGDWFLWIDADEQLVDSHKLRWYLDAAIFHGFVIHQKHLFADQAPNYDIPVRLFRTRDDIQFYGCVHEQPQMGDCNGDIHPTLEPMDLEILHTGYLTQDIRERKRTQRNLPLIVKDQQVFPDRLLGKVILLREVVLQTDARRQAYGGRMVPAVVAGYQQAVDLFVKHFDDPGHKYAQLARPWYESALRNLGIGFEMELALAGKLTLSGGLQGSHARQERVVVRDADELQRILAYQAQQVGQQMAPSYDVKTNPDLRPTPAWADAREVELEPVPV